MAYRFNRLSLAWFVTACAAAVLVNVVHEIHGDEPPPAKNTRLVQGRVTSADGKPVEQADVFLQVERTDFRHRPGLTHWTPLQQTVTDPNGRFSFRQIPDEEQRLRVVARHRLHPPQAEVINVDPDVRTLEVNMLLERGVSISGTVVDEQDHPVPDISFHHPRVYDIEPLSTTSDEQGHFTLTGLKPGTFPEFSGWSDQWKGCRRRGDGTAASPLQYILEPPKVKGFRGAARFNDGEPLANMLVKLYFDDSYGSTRSYGPVQTNDRGRFVIDIPRNVIQDIKRNLRGRKLVPARIEAIDGTDWYTTNPRWLTSFKWGFGSRGFCFDRSHSIRVRQSAANPLPEELEVVVTLDLAVDSHRHRVAQIVRPGTDLSDVVFDGLSPGPYKVSVGLNKTRYEWREELTIPNDAEGTSQELTFDIPELHFGAIKVHVVEADGTTPVQKETGWTETVTIEATKTYTWARIENGIARLPAVPAGPVKVSWRNRDYATEPLRGTIIAGEELDIGTLVPVPLEAAYGTIRGRVLLPDGRPALGANVHPDETLWPLDNPEKTRVDGRGAYLLHLPPGRHDLVFDLCLCPLWPPGLTEEEQQLFRNDSSIMNGSNPMTRRLIRSVDTAKGTTQEMTIDLPDGPFRDVTLQLTGFEYANATLVTALGDDKFEMRSSFHMGTRITFSKVPSVATQVQIHGHSLYSGAERKPSFHGFYTIPASDEDVVIDSDASQAGLLTFRDTAAKESKNYDVTYELRVANSDPNDSIARLMKFDRHYIDQRGTGDSHSVTLRVVPGRYEIIAHQGTQTHSRTIELQANMEEHVDLSALAPEH